MSVRTWKRFRTTLGATKLLVVVSVVKFKLRVLNFCGRRSATAAGGVMVTLTSYGDRLQQCHLAIESIARGSTRPGRLVLWLSEADYHRPRTRQLHRLMNRGLEVRITGDYGPHTKYFPAVTQGSSKLDAMVTADDDIMYPRDWLRKLVDGHLHYPGEIICHRARVIEFDESGRFRPYGSWRQATKNDADAVLFITGVSGVLYPSSAIDALANRGTSFLELCPKADDIWLNHTAHMNNLRIRLINERSKDFLPTEANQKIGLKHDNVTGSGNDTQLLLTYSFEDQAKLSQLQTPADARSRIWNEPR